uniref:Somatolactin beta n=1 Tax=Astyanax mexicanus TaxID=7994 RepID=A0A8B9KZJ5_ASTMX
KLIIKRNKIKITSFTKGNAFLIKLITIRNKIQWVCISKVDFYCCGSGCNLPVTLKKNFFLQEQMFIPFSFHAQQSHGGHLCTSNIFPIPTSKSEVQQISDKWLLHSVLILIQFWIDPLVELQASLDRYDNAPSDLLNKTKWMSTKLMNLEQGVLVLIRKMLEEGSLELHNNESVTPYLLPTDMVEHVLRDYAMLSCFKKDAHKMETFLKFLKCRQTNRPSCSIL